VSTNPNFFGGFGFSSEFDLTASVVVVPIATKEILADLHVFNA
jgi:hypothetical protein